MKLLAIFVVIIGIIVILILALALPNVPGGIIAARASQCGDLEAFVSPQYWRGLKERVAWRAPGVTKVEDHIVVRNEALEHRAVDQKTFKMWWPARFSRWWLSSISCGFTWVGQSLSVAGLHLSG